MVQYKNVLHLAKQNNIHLSTCSAYTRLRIVV